jgi:hypothetical protein
MTHVDPTKQLNIHITLKRYTFKAPHHDNDGTPRDFQMLRSCQTEAMGKSNVVEAYNK